MVQNVVCCVRVCFQKIMSANLYPSPSKPRKGWKRRKEKRRRRRRNRGEGGVGGGSRWSPPNSVYFVSFFKGKSENIFVVLTFYSNVFFKKKSFFIKNAGHPPPHPSRTKGKELCRSNEQTSLTFFVPFPWAAADMIGAQWGSKSLFLPPNPYFLTLTDLALSLRRPFSAAIAQKKKW